MRVKGRLNDDVNHAQAREEIAAIGEDLARAYPAANQSQRLTVRTDWQLRTSGPDAAIVGMLLTMAGMVLLAACANVAGLLTSRAPARAREVALRLALGAGRVRIVRQLLTESLLLAGVGGVVGVAIAYRGIALLQRIEFPTEVPLKLGFALDERVLVAALIATVVSAVLSSLIPALQATKRDLVTTIKGGTAAQGPVRQWGRHALVTAQVALSLVVLTVPRRSRMP
jgi:ABC-type antimicrobial peptide transport system permease subunit